jgi:hypothetical protein
LLVTSTASLYYFQQTRQVIRQRGNKFHSLIGPGMMDHKSFGVQSLPGKQIQLGDSSLFNAAPFLFVTVDFIPHQRKTHISEMNPNLMRPAGARFKPQ